MAYMHTSGRIGSMSTLTTPVLLASDWWLSILPRSWVEEATLMGDLTDEE